MYDHALENRTKQRRTYDALLALQVYTVVWDKRGRVGGRDPRATLRGTYYVIQTREVERPHWKPIITTQEHFCKVCYCKAFPVQHDVYIILLYSSSLIASPVHLTV